MMTPEETTALRIAEEKEDREVAMALYVLRTAMHWPEYKVCSECGSETIGSAFVNRPKSGDWLLRIVQAGNYYLPFQPWATAEEAAKTMRAIATGVELRQSAREQESRS